MAYLAGIDLGTTFCAAAVSRSGHDVEVVTLGNHAAAVPSVLYVGADGTTLLGEAAERRVLTDPDRVLREFKRRIGDDTPLRAGGQALAAHEVAARFVAWILERIAEREGGPADAVTVAHPASWGPHKLELLRTSLEEAGLTDLEFLTEPEAAACAYANVERVAPGTLIGVYDLGGGTFDAAVVRKSADRGFEVLGRPVGLERLGGIDFDDALFRHVLASCGQALADLDGADPSVLSAVGALRRECVSAKEALSADTETVIPVLLPTGASQVRVTRAELEEMIRPAIAETVAVMRAAFDAAEVSEGDVSSILLVGGSSRIPLVAQLLSAEFGLPVAMDTDPKASVAMGAALARQPVDVVPEPDAPGTALAPATWGELDVTDAEAALVSRPASSLTGPGIESDPHAGARRTRRIALVGLGSAVAMVALAGTAAELAGSSPVAALSSVGPGSAPTAQAAVGEETPTDPWTGRLADEKTTPPGPTRPGAKPAAAPPAADRTTPAPAGTAAAPGPSSSADPTQSPATTTPPPGTTEGPPPGSTTTAPPPGTSTEQPPPDPTTEEPPPPPPPDPTTEEPPPPPPPDPTSEEPPPPPPAESSVAETPPE